MIKSNVRKQDNDSFSCYCSYLYRRSCNTACKTSAFSLFSSYFPYFYTVTCVGADADLTILDINKEIVVDVNKFESKSRNNPFHGWKLKGSPVMTIVGGKVVYPF